MFNVATPPLQFQFIWCSKSFYAGQNADYGADVLYGIQRAIW